MLKKHWPDATLYSDIREVNPNEIEKVDVLCGGFPCQPVSVSGRRRGDADERWLWPEFARLVRGIRPQFVVVENVPGLLTVDSGRLFGGVLGDLASCGYDAEWQVLSAASVGAWHRRDRLFIVAYPNRQYCPALGKKVPREERETIRLAHGGEYVSNANCQRLAQREVFGSNAQQKLTAFARNCSAGAGIWAVESDVVRVADGVPRRVERLEALGNAVVPQVAEYVARQIREFLVR